MAQETTTMLDASQIANLKQLRVQSGSLNRYTKELNDYIKDVQYEKQQLQDLRNSNSEQKDEEKKTKIKMKRQAIAETENVIRDIRPKLIKTWESVDHLMKILKEFESEDKELFKNVQKYLSNAEGLVN